MTKSAGKCGSLVIIAVLASGCEAGSMMKQEEGPSAEVIAAAGTYNLFQANNTTPPARAGSTSGGCARFIDSGTLTLTSVPQSYHISLAIRAVCIGPSGPNTVTGTVETMSSWSISGSNLTLSLSNGITTSAATLADGVVRTTVSFDWVGQLQAPVAYRKQ